MKPRATKDLRQSIVGKTLQKWRIDARLTQFDLAQRLGYSTAQFVSNWERGMSLPPQAALPKLVKILSVEPRAMMELLVSYQEQLVVEESRRLRQLLRIR